LNKFSNGLGQKTKCDVTLVIPLGKEKSIFPWGVNLIRDYLRNSDRTRNVQILDLSNDEEIDNFFSSYTDDLLYLTQKMRPGAAEIFAGNSPYQQAFYGVVAALGSKFLKIANENNMYPYFSNFLRRRRIESRLNKMKEDFQKLIITKMKALCSTANDYPHIWGISTYDKTALNALFLADTIRQYIKPTMLVLGGDYWDFDSAWVMMRDSNLVDGVVVGYGERVLTEIIHAVTNRTDDKDLSQLYIVGLINKLTISREKQCEDLFPLKKEIANNEIKSQPKQQSISVPAEYSKKISLPFRLVHHAPRNKSAPTVIKVNMLTQRGCSYGACQFCTQIDKHLFFNFPIDLILEQLREFFEKLQSENKIVLSIDNDEICESTLVSLIDFLKDYDEQLLKVVTWLQVKIVSPKILEALINAGNASKYFFAINWESLNPITLKHMGKGHTPLQAICASKAIADSGAGWGGNYMIWFPKQDKESKIQELKFLRAASHLAYGNSAYCWYYSNKRDNISKRAESFGIVVKHNIYDIWISKAFKVDLDYSLSMYSWRTRSSKTAQSIVSRLFAASLTSIRKRFFLMGHLFNSAVSLIPGYSVYGKILPLYRWLVLANPLKLEKNVFSLAGKTLLRHSTAPAGNKDNIKIELNDETITVLRCAYWPVTEAQLSKNVSSHISAFELKPVLDELERLGAIIRHCDKMVSVVNDPDYWIKFDP
jgi:radical SAM superfamily enzyme YgiQ (UPF0313 family)